MPCILQYLTSRGYLQTVASFQTELQHRPRQATPTQTAGLQVCVCAYTSHKMSFKFRLCISEWISCCIWMWRKSRFFRSLESECASCNIGTRPNMSKPGISPQCLFCNLPHSYRGKGLTKQSHVPYKDWSRRSFSPQIGDKAHSFQEFTEYLAMRSAVLAKSPELATYCALAYVPDPTCHPAFKKLFTVGLNLY